MNVSFDLIGVHRWFGGDLRPQLDIARMADRMGIDEISVNEHVVMGEALDTYPYGNYPLPLDEPYFEPMATLSAIAAVTERIKLTTNILISPLRPAALLAKQLATLDMLSEGRVEIGVGTGWQEAEYIASGIPWEGRYTRLEEQLRICKVLWSEAPASFSGKTVSFERIHAFPRPYKRTNMPIYFGLAPSERNCARVAELGDGWVPIVQSPEEIAAGVEQIRKAFIARGRDPAELKVRALCRMVMSPEGRPDLEASLAQAPALRAAGVTTLIVMPILFCQKPDDLPKFFEALLSCKG